MRLDEAKKMMKKMPLFEEFMRNLKKLLQNVAKKIAYKTPFYFKKVRKRLQETDGQKILNFVKEISPLRSIEKNYNFKKFNFLEKKIRIKQFFSSGPLPKFGIFKNFNVFSSYHFLKEKDPLKFLNRWLSPFIRNQLLNIFAIILPYSIVSYIIYPEFSGRQFLQEIFSLICVYAAIFFWFMDYIVDSDSSNSAHFSKPSRYRLSVAVTACVAPIFFLNNSFAVAFVEILLLIFAEFICSEYMRGCLLFSNKIPVFIVCDTQNDFVIIEKSLREKYKLLDVIIIECCTDMVFRRLCKKLKNINQFSFFPCPRRILYFGLSSSPINRSFVVSKLLDLSAQFSIPIFKLKYVEDAVRGDSFHLFPYSASDIDFVSISPQEESMIFDVFKDKSVWIFYDGRKCVQDLIRALSDVANLTVFCASEYLMREVEAEFDVVAEKNLSNPRGITQINRNFLKKTHKVKIADKNILLGTDSKPEILFFNTPLLHLDSSEDNLKEAVVKNVLDVSDIVNTAVKLNVKFVFFLSTMEAFETKNWIGATQRLGELYVQWISYRKSQTKFRIIRLPYCIADPAGLFNTVENALQNEKSVSGDFRLGGESRGGEDGAVSETAHCCNYYNRDAIFHPLLKLVIHTLRDSYILPDIFSIFPTYPPKSFDEVAEVMCKLSGIEIGRDVPQGVTAPSVDFSSSFLVDSGKFEETTIDPAIVLTRAPASLKYREPIFWNLEQLNQMSTRDVISAVFQSLNNTKKSPGEGSVAFN